MSNDAKHLIHLFCKNGDKSAFSQFYQTQSTRLWRFLVAKGNDEDTAYEILSESFLRFMQKICTQPLSPVAYLYRIALNLQVDRWRRTQQATAWQNDQTQQAKFSKDTSEQHMYVIELMSILKNNEQNLLLMRYWLGMSHKEIAQVLDMAEGSVRRQAAATLKKLQQHWKTEV